jgi:hypothetical protein
VASARGALLVRASVKLSPSSFSAFEATALDWVLC